MSGLNLPSFELKTKKQNGKEYIFDRLRKQFVRLTPEEYVRQHFINYLVEYKNYPEGLLANEISIAVEKTTKRCDTVLYNKNLQPVLVIEYKSPNIPITQDTFDQILRYNMSLQVSWLIVSNGINHFCCFIDFEQGSYSFLEEIPEYGRL